MTDHQRRHMKGVIYEMIGELARSKGMTYEEILRDALLLEAWLEERDPPSGKPLTSGLAIQCI